MSSIVDKLAQRLISNQNSGLSSNFLFGIVLSVEPIKVKIEGLPELKETQIILSDRVKEKKIKIEDKEILIQEGLKTGDKVFIIQSNDKQLFYIKEIIKNDTKSKYTRK